MWVDSFRGKVNSGRVRVPIEAFNREAQINPEREPFGDLSFSLLNKCIMSIINESRCLAC